MANRYHLRPRMRPHTAYARDWMAFWTGEVELYGTAFVKALQLPEDQRNRLWLLEEGLITAAIRAIHEAHLRGF